MEIVEKLWPWLLSISVASQFLDAVVEILADQKRGAFGMPFWLSALCVGYVGVLAVAAVYRGAR